MSTQWGRQLAVRSNQTNPICWILTSTDHIKSLKPFSRTTSGVFRNHIGIIFLNCLYVCNNGYLETGLTIEQTEGRRWEFFLKKGHIWRRLGQTLDWGSYYQHMMTTPSDLNVILCEKVEHHSRWFDAMFLLTLCFGGCIKCGVKDLVYIRIRTARLLIPMH